MFFAVYRIIIHRWHSRYDIRLDHRQQCRDIVGCLGGENKKKAGRSIQQKISLYMAGSSHYALKDSTVIYTERERD